MSLLSKFITSNLIKAIEEEFISHAPDMQQRIIEEVESFAHQAFDWVKNKLERNSEEVN